MKPSLKRYIASWVLLAVFVPILIMSSLHVHGVSTENTVSCIDCVQHHCNGHMGQQTTSIHQCVLCQFLTLTFVTAAISAVVIFQPQIKIHYAQLCHDIRLTSCGTISLRAPPVA